MKEVIAALLLPWKRWGCWAGLEEEVLPGAIIWMLGISISSEQSGSDQGYPRCNDMNSFFPVINSLRIFVKGRCINLCGELPPGAPNLVEHKFMNPDLARQADRQTQTDMVSLLSACSQG
jgi:hypothetical protein